MNMQEGTPEGARKQAADALRRLRERAGMSQSGLATAMTERGHSWLQQTVARAEENNRKIEISELFTLAAIFGVPLDAFRWKIAEANAIDWLDMAAERLQVQHAETVRSVAAQLAATGFAAQALEGTAKHVTPQAVRAREILVETIEEYGPVEAAVEAGRRMFDEQVHAGEDEDSGEAASAEA